ncbi:MAG: DEAD/DEAH box helicase [Chloroflexota bacterium]
MTETPPSTSGSPLDAFHPVVRTWFERRFGAPTDAQVEGWPAIRRGGNTLLAAPTGSGKTLAAFLVGIDALVREAEAGTLDDRTRIVYVSPLKALGNDIERNLEVPLAGIRAVAEELGVALAPITTAVRTGDTTAAERDAIARRPPHILITTPESLYLMVTSDRGRRGLANTRTVIVDEIHALARDRRGTHLTLTLARLDHLVRSATGQTPARVGLSATQRPIEAVAAFLAQTGAPCTIVDRGHQRDLELAIEIPPSDLEAVIPKEQMGEQYDRLADLVRQHRTTLIFVNTRRMSERVAHALAERLGEDAVASHHGSISKERRLRVEQRLKSGKLRALVATASLELGIDIGSIDLVCQVGSPRSIATFLQRVGRSGHALGLRPHGLLFPTTRDELVECAALVRAVRAGRLDRIVMPKRPLDVLAQQIVAEVACAEEWAEDDLYALMRHAAPYAHLDRHDFDEIVEMLSEGIGEGAGRAAPLLHRDRIHHVLRPRRAARLTALQNGGTIPETGDYRVVSEPDGAVVGTVNEDFAMESSGGDIFLLGSTSWRISRLGQSTVYVTDAGGAPPTIPFWLGEAPGRTIELSQEVGRLRREVAAGLDGDRSALRAWLAEECALPPLGADQIIDYLAATRDGLGVVPSDTDVVFERFFDDTGGMQLVVHAPFGQRINRAWGLALRKRFCVAFDFELQAAANDDSILLSAGPQHSWPLEEAYEWVKPGNVEEAVHSSVFYIPMFPARWRWNTTRALAVPRMRGGKPVPPFLQRMRADDLMAAVFPEQVGCQENMQEPLTLPDHPLMRQTMRDCLFEAMDVEGLRGVLQRVEAGAIRYHARDTVEPSPMAHEIVSGRPYTYLDDAPIEERRTRAITLRRGLPEHARDLATLDPEAIAQVAGEAWPQPRDAEEVHDALLGLVVVDEAWVEDWTVGLDALATARRAASFETAGRRLWFAAEHREVVALIFPDAAIPSLDTPAHALTRLEHREEARALALRGHAEACGVTTPADLASRSGLDAGDAERGLRMLEAQGFVLRGRFTPGAPEDEWCDRRLLARIHRYTLDRLRREIDPASRQDFMRFLLRWQHLAPGAQVEGRGGLRQVIERLAGFEAPASAWETELLRQRMAVYQPSWLDELCLAGEAAWARLTPKRVAGEPEVARLAGSATRATPITIAPRMAVGSLLLATRAYGPGDPPLGVAGAAGEIAALLARRGALFFDGIVAETRRLVTDVEQGLRELVAAGVVASDGFEGLRELAGTRRSGGRRERSRGAGNYLRGGLFAGGGPPGRWSLVRTPDLEAADEDTLAEAVAMRLLQRYGVVFRDVALREPFTMPWRLVMRALRRMEARGTVRGGRFVLAVAGEQYALPEAVTLLRAVRNEPHTGQRVTVSAVDPVNLTGVLLPGDRVPAQRGRTVTFVDGLPEHASPEVAATR